MKKWIIIASLIALAFVVLALRDEPPPVKKPAVVEKVAVVEPVVEAEPVDLALLETALLGKKEEIVEEVPIAQPERRRVRRPVFEDEPLDEEAPEVGLTDFDFQSTVGSWDGVKGCLATSSVRGEDKMRGALQVSFTIRTDGAVLDSRVVDASNDEAETLVPCVERKAKRIKFPAFAGTDVTRTAKFVF